MTPTFILASELMTHDAGVEIARHAHDSGQLSVVLSGTMTVTVDSGWWLVPPGLAIWIPPGELHAARYSEASSLMNVKFGAAFAAQLPAQGAPLVVSGLLRELAHEATRLSGQDEAGATLSLIAGLIVHQALLRLDAPGLFVPSGRDRRLRHVIDLLRDNPGNNASIAVLAGLAHTSSRTLARLFVEETNLTFGHWREHLRIVCAVDRLTRGQSITETALELGYQSASSFSTLFTRLLGEPPRRYMRRWEKSVDA